MSKSQHFPVIVDWGTSNFRAYRFDADGLAKERRAEAGILSVADGAFETTLRATIGDWIAPHVEILLSGMITSRNGWVETPYVLAPAALRDLRDNVIERQLADGARLKFLPGVAQRAPQPDVMRGEEIQAFGAVKDDADATVILPGTHSKWVTVESGRIMRFTSMMTGEMYAALTKHTILGRLINAKPQAFRAEAFARGVELSLSGAAGGFLNHIFTARSGVLVGAMEQEDVADYLSGVVIGAELRDGLKLAPRGRETILIGDERLTARYAEAFKIAGVDAVIGDARATVAGFRKLAALS